VREREREREKEKKRDEFFIVQSGFHRTLRGSCIRDRGGSSFSELLPLPFLPQEETSVTRAMGRGTKNPFVSPSYLIERIERVNYDTGNLNC